MKLATLDFETDPFEHGKRVAPFDVGFFDGEMHKEIWHDDCANLIIDYIDSLDEPYIIYAHNGGKFDFFFFLERLDRQIRIVRGRILEASFTSSKGIRHVFRDSYAIIPIPLRQYEKDDIDYKKLHKKVRDRNKQEIQKYRRQDCKGLYELVSRFRERFGNALTIAGAAQKELKKFHPFKSGKEQFDRKFRPYFYGGRVQCFEGGLIEGNFKVYDVNSMYPDAMRNQRHPIGTRNTVSDRIGPNTFLVEVQAKNYGAFPKKLEDGSLSFDVERGRFFVTIHEIEAALETGTAEIERINRAYDFEDWTYFDSFVDYWYGLRQAAQKSKDFDRMAKIDYLLFKLILNSAYGKFGMDSREFADSMFTLNSDLYIPEPFCSCVGICLCTEPTWRHAHENDKYIIWEKPIERPYFYNVATAASITGAARAKLLRALAKAKRPVYCDTDSIICEGLDAQIDGSKLGAWKLEATGNRIAIGGKKMYAVFDDAKAQYEDVQHYNYKNFPHVETKKLSHNELHLVKKASKGGQLSPDQIVAVAQGKTVKVEMDAPRIGLDGTWTWVHREIRSTLPNFYGRMGKPEMKKLKRAA